MPLKSVEAVAQLLAQLDDEEPGFILINQLEKLHDLISPIPDLSWDIMEDSEKRLLVEFDGAKERWQPLLNGNRLGIMLNKVEELEKLLRANNGTLWCQPLMDTEVVPEDQYTSVKGTTKLNPERKFWLGADNQIKVL